MDTKTIAQVTNVKLLYQVINQFLIAVLCFRHWAVRQCI